MTVGELREKLAAWPQDAEIAVLELRPMSPVDARPVKDLSYWTAYNMAFVVID